MSGDDGPGRALLHVPEPNGAVFGWRRRPLAIRRDGNIADRGLMPGEGNFFLSQPHVPESKCAVVATGQDDLPVARKGTGEDGAAVSAQFMCECELRRG